MKHAPPNCKNLSGIIDLFSQSLGITSLHHTIHINSRFTYILAGYSDKKWKEIMFQANDKLPIYLMNWGTTTDPIEAIHISCRWPSFTEGSIFKLNPENAPYWSIRCIKQLEYIVDIFFIFII